MPLPTPPQRYCDPASSFTHAKFVAHNIIDQIVSDKIHKIFRYLACCMHVHRKIFFLSFATKQIVLSHDRLKSCYRIVRSARTEKAS